MVRNDVGRNEAKESFGFARAYAVNGLIIFSKELEESFVALFFTSFPKLLST